MSVEKEIVHENAQEIVLDGSNSVSFPGFPFTFTALGEKILVTLDQFKSGYECKTCKGAGKVTSKVTGNLVVCSDCDGKSVKEGGLIIPDTAKMLANSGVVVSMGDKAMKDTRHVYYNKWYERFMFWKAKKYTYDFRLGDRVLFSAHAGSLIPTRAGIAFKYMDYYQPIAKVDGAEDLASFDFIVPEEAQI